MTFAFVPAAFVAEKKLSTSADIAVACYAVGDSVIIADGATRAKRSARAETRRAGKVAPYGYSAIGDGDDAGWKVCGVE